MLSTFVCFEDLVTNAGVGMVCYLGDVVFVFDAVVDELGAMQRILLLGMFCFDATA